MLFRSRGVTQRLPVYADLQLEPLNPGPIHGGTGGVIAGVGSRDSLQANMVTRLQESSSDKCAFHLGLGRRTRQHAKTKPNAASASTEGSGTGTMAG